MQRTTWAWLAGLFEGEGSLTFAGKHAASMSIASTDLDVLVRARALTGGMGAIYQRRPTADRKPIWTWVVSRADHLRTFLAKVGPYLGERRAMRADEVLERIGAIARPGFCLRGHALADTVYTTPSGQRLCRECVAIRNSYRRQKA